MPTGHAANKAHLGVLCEMGEVIPERGGLGKAATALGDCEGQRPPGRTELSVETKFWGEHISKLCGRKAVHVEGETGQK